MSALRLRRRTSTRPFTPQNIAGAVGVWIADDIGLSDAAAVSSWTDRKSSLALTQATGGQQPLYRTSGIGGQPAVDFDGSNDLLRYAAALSTASSGSVFVVLRVDTLTGTPWCEGNESSTTRYVLSSITGAGNLDIEQRNSDTDDIAHTTTTTLTTATNYLCEWQSLDTSYAFRINGVTQSKTVTSGSDSGDWFADSSGLSGFVIGALKRTTESDFLDGKVAAVIVVDGAISSDDRTALNAWVSSKYGITIS